MAIPVGVMEKGIHAKSFNKSHIIKGNFLPLLNSMDIIDDSVEPNKDKKKLESF